MSFDLGLKPTHGSEKAFLGALRHKLRSLPGMSARDSLFDYSSDRTGVHFLIDFHGKSPDDKSDAVATLIVNYVRPSPFVREAASLLQSVSRDVTFEVFDEQDGGPWQPFDAERLIDSYLKHARRAYRALAMGMDDLTVHSVPTNVLRYGWHWNSDSQNKAQRCEADGRDLVVPVFEFVEIEGHVFSYTLWNDGEATLLPLSDLVGFQRSKHLARSGGLFSRKRPTLEFISRTTVLELLGDTYHSDPVWTDAMSPADGTGRAGQERLLSRSLGQDAVCDLIYLDDAHYESLASKPFQRLHFADLIDKEWTRQPSH